MEKLELGPDGELPVRIARAIRDAIVEGRLIVDQRLPSEQELAEQFGVSRPTVREALKRLAAQSLIRTQRGATGGAFVNRISYEEAADQQITTSTLLLSMNAVDFETACEARYALERACVPFAAGRREADHLAAMRAEIHRQTQRGLSDEGFCASDVAFHRALVDAAGNPILSYQLAGAVEAMQPLMNMITFTARSRERIVSFHTAIADAIEARDAGSAEAALAKLADYTVKLVDDVRAKRQARR
ncbi:Putative L-lactate dehydrogenase operon regulatory protein [Defluviimonas aquaemixtae]|uniref:L-lactate dehydrogenase operon regulatory protein n=1 Tax=Albidovulum aquaemixtae TaxID=1542388 RepID=A0A2R8B5Y5_9RHOB|nr:GntR family transcriptional regulator [Defluviimonas aquaemixtae]SPH18004.1 Putative L-lactate dehydrogenase operon regulatory protein [Defluviimonas aquaemixtae]